MKSNVFLFKELKGSKVDCIYDKEEIQNATFVDFDLDGKFIFLRQEDGELRVIWWPGAKKFELRFKEPQIPPIPEVNPSNSPEPIFDDYFRD